MPTYEYGCKFCDHRFERYQGITAKTLVKCPECGRRGLQRMFGTGAGFVFKGSGFHQTDYRSSGYKAAQKADKPGGGDECGGPSACDSCPAKDS